MRKLISLIMAVLVVFTAFGTPISAFALDNIPQKSNTVNGLTPSGTFNVGGFVFKIWSNLNKEAILWEYNGTDTDIVIPKEVEGYTVTAIQTNAFKEMDIESVVIPEGVTFINYGAFQNCKNLKKVVMQGNMDIIESYAFSYCYNLEEVIMPDTLNEIGSNAFYNCESLKSIVIPEGVKTISSTAFTYCSSLESVVMADSVTKLEDYVFSDCGALKEVKLSENLKTMGIGNFREDKSLKNIVLPGSIEEVSHSTFKGCDSLETVVFSDGYSAVVSEEMFADCVSLKKVVLADSVTGLNKRAFANCTSLEEITLSSTIPKIEDECFINCLSLKSISIPASVTEIGDNAFLKCKSLEEVEFSEGLKSINQYSFYKCTAIKKLKFPDSLETIGFRAFSECSAALSIEFGSGFKEADEYAFELCTSVKNDIKIPESTQTLKKGAFLDCAGIEKVYLPEGDIAIDSTAFQGCEPIEMYRYNSKGIRKIETIIPEYDAHDTIIYDASKLDSFKDRTKQAVTDEYIRVSLGVGTYDDNDRATWFEIPSSTTSPYAYGKLTQDTHDTVTQMTNFYRWLTGANPLKNKSVHSDSLQAQALDRNFYFDHYIPDDAKPDDMSQELWDEGAKCTHTILARSISPKSAIEMWLNEGYSVYYNTWGTVGHRLSLISPRVSDIQFGYSGNISIGQCVKYDNEFKEPFTAFPAPGPMPNVAVNPYNSAWTICYDTDKITYKEPEEVCVKVTNLNTEESYICTVENKMLNIDDGLCFAQPSDFLNGRYTDTYRVEVTGLYGVENDVKVEIHYDVDFYDIRDYKPLNVENYFFDINSINLCEEPDDDLLNFLMTYLSDYVCVVVEEDVYVYLSLNDKWSIDKENSCFKNTANMSDMPDNITDPNNYLDDIKVEYSSDYFSNGGEILFSTGTDTVTEGDKIEFTVSERLFGNEELYIYKIVKDDSGNTAYKCVYSKSEDKETHDIYNYERVPIYTKEHAEPDDDGDYFVLEKNMHTIFVSRMQHFTVNHKFNEGTVLKESDCTHEGEILYKCEICGEEQIKPLEMAEHTIVEDKYKFVTCQEEGLTWGTHCSVCGKVIVPQEVIPKAEHYVVIDFEVEPTCYSEGLTEGSHCENCGKVLTKQEVIPKKEHEETAVKKGFAPDCEDDGLTDGVYCTYCGEWIVPQEIIPATGHTIVTDEAVEPTCTESGLTEGSHCKICGKIIVPQEIIPEKGHSLVTDEAVEPTCTESGLTEGSHCEVCKTVFHYQEVIPPKGHIYENGVCIYCGEKEDTFTDTDTDTHTDTNTDTKTKDIIDTESDTEQDTDTGSDTDTDSKDTSDPEKDGVLIGDVNGDGKVKAIDSMIVQRAVLNLVKLDERQIITADVNGDEKINNKDALEILRYTIHLKSSERIGKKVAK